VSSVESLTGRSLGGVVAVSCSAVSSMGMLVVEWKRRQAQGLDRDLGELCAARELPSGVEAQAEKSADRG